MVVSVVAFLVSVMVLVAVFTVKLAKRDAPNQLLLVMGAAGSFAAISVIFGSPIVAAVLVIEASGLGGAMLPLILIPGLISAGIGSLVFIGMADWSGLNTSAYSLVPLHMPAFAHPTWVEIGWTIVIGIVAGLLTEPVRRIGLETAKVVGRRAFVLIPAVGVIVGALALLFASTTTHGIDQVLFSGQEQLPDLVNNAGTYSLGALAMIMLCKGLAWGVSLGSFRGGPTFPAIFIGSAGGILASHLPGMQFTPAVAVGMAAATVAFLKLPLSAVAECFAWP